MSVGAAGPAGALALSLLSMTAATPAASLEEALIGAWAQAPEECSAIFSGSGKSVSFKKPVKAFAQAFIISGNQIRTPNASCRVNGVKRSGDRRILALACATSVAVDEVPASLEPLADGTLRRFLNDQDKAGSKYERCAPPAKR
jgi:hypothetical protein